jgi:hypothetical protein
LPDASVFNLVFPALIAVGFLATFGVECGVEFLEVFATAVALVLIALTFGGEVSAFRATVITAKKSIVTEGVEVFVTFVTAFGACDNLAIASTFVGLTDITVVAFFVAVIVAFPAVSTHFVSKVVGTIGTHSRLVVSLGETEDMNIFAEFNFTLGAFLDFFVRAIITAGATVFVYRNDEVFVCSETVSAKSAGISVIVSQSTHFVSKVVGTSGFWGEDGGDEFFVVFAFSFGEDCFNLDGGQTSILTGGCDFCIEFAGSLVVSVLVANGAGHSDCLRCVCYVWSE